MDLIERLRPRWRHSDPEVRAAAVREMGAEDQERVAALASEDPDPRVRRIAIKKLEDAARLERLTESEADGALRELAAERLRDVLVRTATSDAPERDCAAALARLTDPRSLAAVASAAVHDGVRRGALERVTGDGSLRDVVRAASDPAIRQSALERIQDGAMLRGIAVGDYPAEVALGALARIEDTPSLRAVADSRTAGKAARQRARALLATRSPEQPPVGVKEARARQIELCSAVHSLRVSTDVVSAAEQVRAAQREWNELARHVEPHADLADRFVKGCETILEDAASLARRQAAADHARVAREENVAAHVALCERIEALDGADVPRALAEARAAWSRLPHAADAALSRRFAVAGDESMARHQRWLAADAIRAEHTRVVEDAEALAGAPQLASSKQWRALERRWESRTRAAGASDEIAALERRFTAAGERLRGRRQDAEQQRSAQQRENLTRLEALVTRLREMAEAETLKPSAGRRELQEAEAALHDLGPLPASEQRATWTERLAEARDLLLRRVAQEEQAEDWRRWANVGAQEELIRRVEALLEANDLAEGTRQLGRLQDEWAAVATASPDKSQALWERFRTARNELRRRCDAYLAENLARKKDLCAQVAEVGDSTAWNETAELIRRVQAEWKGIGPVPGKHTKTLWQQFRDPCDRFFARRKEHFSRLDDERREAAKQKIALCEQAEALAESTDWDATAAAVKQLQAEWKRSGPPPRDQADALWHRFRTACDRFFDRSRRRDELAREDAVRNVGALCEELEALVGTLGGDDPSATAGIGPKLDEAWGAWVRLDHKVSGDAQAFGERLRVACEQIASAHPEGLRGTRLDPDVTRKRREKLCARLEGLVPSGNEAPRATSLQEMAMALRDRLATNTIAGAAAKSTGRPEDVGREVERIEASWTLLGPPLDEDARALADRFERARARVRHPSR